MSVPLSGRFHKSILFDISGPHVSSFIVVLLLLLLLLSPPRHRISTKEDRVFQFSQSKKAQNNNTDQVDDEMKDTVRVKYREANIEKKLNYVHKRMLEGRTTKL